MGREKSIQKRKDRRGNGANVKKKRETRKRNEKKKEGERGC